MQRTLTTVVAALSLLVTTEARAAFHLNLIDEVKSGVGGNPDVQYVEIRTFAGQDIVGNTRLTAFSCDGTASSVLLLVPSNVANSGSGVRFIMATTAFAAASGITPDFTWNPATSGSIPTTCGMVCWGAPGFAPPSPGTWDATDPNQYVDCVAYGPYTGPRKTSDHDGTRPSGTPTTLTPGDAILSLTRTNSTGNNVADFATSCPSPTNNDGDTGGFGQCPPATTTTITVTTSTTVTTAPPTTTTATTLPPTTTTSTTEPTTTTTTETTSTTAPTTTTTTVAPTTTTTETTSTTAPTTTTTTETTSTTAPTTTSTTTTPASTTTTTTGAPRCGNGILEGDEQCDPPWSRNSAQCPPEPGRRFGPECGDDCRCVTSSTTTPTTTSTSSTTTTTTTTTSTTAPPVGDIQCCVTSSPEPAFPEGVTCEFLKPAECDGLGGVNFGPGSCDPNPCVTTTTTLLGLTALGCGEGATMSSVKCRLASLTAMVSEAGDMHGLGTKLSRSLARAGANLARAETLQLRGQQRRARAFVRRAAHDLKTLAKQLRSRRATRLLSPASRSGMLGLAEPLRLDLQAIAPAR